MIPAKTDNTIGRCSSGAALRAPFPWFGGKSRVAHEVWPRLGNVPNYIEPFFGSGAMLLNRPHPAATETINDIDGFVANFWRAISLDPNAVAAHADYPVFENDLHARHAWLVAQKDNLPARLEGDPNYYDAQIAGWWCWGLCAWIGAEFCSGKGPWQPVDGLLVHTAKNGHGIERKRPMISGNHAGKGVYRTIPHLGDTGRRIERKRPHIGDAGRGINRKRPRLGDFGETGVNATDFILNWFEALSGRLRRVRVCCGDWSRITGPSVTCGQHGLTGVFLDPPYNADAERDGSLYRCDCTQISHAVRQWAIEQGSNPLMRIALCGYEGEHHMPADWECLAWKQPGGYGGQNMKVKNNNGAKERIWFSPYCLNPAETLL
jgi:hypothetical protein